MCAPNDVWSLGVILVNLTCGRNPWKQASFQDSTYRAFVRSQEFLKTILPLTDGLNAILGRIFEPTPEHRVTLPELRKMILACPSFTLTPNVGTTSPSLPAETTEYFNEDVIVDDYDCGSPVSDSSVSSDDPSLISSASTLDDLDEDFLHEQHEVRPELAARTYESEESLQDMLPPHPHHVQEFIPQHYSGPIPILPTQQHMLVHQVPPQAPAAHCVMPMPAKCSFPFWDVLKYVQQAPIMQNPAAFHHPMMFPTFQGGF